MVIFPSPSKSAVIPELDRISFLKISRSLLSTFLSQLASPYDFRGQVEEVATIKNENLKPLNYMEKGVVLGFDEKGNVKQNGTIDVKAFAGDKYSDGTQVDTIAKLPIGTKIEGGILKTGSARQEDKVQQYLEFSCDSVQGDFHDPKVEEKIIQLDENTICVVPWMNVAGQ